MKHVVVFHSAQWANAAVSAYEDVQAQANVWLEFHTQATILASHTNMTAEAEWTEFALTLIVEMPGEEQTHG
jgi:hypothetical protein